MSKYKGLITWRQVKSIRSHAPRSIYKRDGKWYAVYGRREPFGNRYRIVHNKHRVKKRLRSISKKRR